MKIKVVLPLVALILSSFATIQAQNKIQINSKELSTLLQNDNKIVVIDVRTASEFNDGHIKGALNIDLHQPDVISRLDELNKETKYVVYCRTSSRSGVVVNYMIQSGFNTVYQMTDGFPGWVANKLPYVK